MVLSLHAAAAAAATAAAATVVSDRHIYSECLYCCAISIWHIIIVGNIIRIVMMWVRVQRCSEAIKYCMIRAGRNECRHQTNMASLSHELIIMSHNKRHNVTTTSHTGTPSTQYVYHIVLLRFTNSPERMYTNDIYGRYTALSAVLHTGTRYPGYFPAPLHM